MQSLSLTVSLIGVMDMMGDWLARCELCGGMYQRSTLRDEVYSPGRVATLCKDGERCNAAHTVYEIQIGTLPMHWDGCDCVSCTSNQVI